ncbi:NUDIX domain-containing protein [Photobacterium ganghwense]|uniref:Nudix hydrolase domain-containing protein n=1 Tax=Photobacterium ganghwense TaxID=320778 RepID=A0A0J1HAC4_9GAMM|nr:MULTISPECIES: NUDIX domain-containing protein [Photobacterium]KLV08613.1 hypothetical protein ABT57_12310 [Photobacterium ganghwense]PSU10729.1 NUDIX domain-containing protein [Photobacterium ganghwense]QSV12873.1 NUDIX domain-containing protein [Photobacterium ganghwense]
MKPRVSLLLINPKREILLIHRIKEERDYWVFPGGGVEQGESLLTAAQREALEETSFVLQQFSPVFSLLNMGRREHFFVANVDNIPARLGNGPELEKQNIRNRYELVWLPFEQLSTLELYPMDARDIAVTLLVDVETDSVQIHG